MRSALAALARQTVVYGLSGVILPFVGLITLPIFARYFSPAKYGVIEIATVTSALVYVFIDLGLAAGSQRSYFDYTDEQETQRRGVIKTAVLTSFTIACAVASIFVALASPIGDALFKSRNYTTVVVLVGITLPFTVVMQLSREVMRLTFRPWHYFVSATMSGVIAAGVGVVAVLSLKSDVAGVFWGLLFGSALAAAYGVTAVHRSLSGRVSRPELRTMLAYGIPLMPTALAGWGLVFLDRFLLGGLGNLAAVGQYAVANRVVSVLLFAVTAFSLAFSPYILSLYSEDRELELQTRAQVLSYLAIALTGVGVALSVFAREIIALVAPSYGSAYESVALLSFGTIAFGLGTVAMTGISFVRATHWFAIYTIIAVAVNLLVNLVLIPPFGQVGAAAATAVAYALLAVLYYRKAQQLYPTPFETARVLRTTGLGALVMPIGLIAIHPAGLGVAVHAAAIAAFVLLLRPLGIIGAREWDALREVFANRAAALTGTRA